MYARHLRAESNASAKSKPLRSITPRFNVSIETFDRGDNGLVFVRCSGERRENLHVMLARCEVSMPFASYCRRLNDHMLRAAEGLRTIMLHVATSVLMSSTPQQCPLMCFFTSWLKGPWSPSTIVEETFRMYIRWLETDAFRGDGPAMRWR